MSKDKILATDYIIALQFRMINYVKNCKKLSCKNGLFLNQMKLKNSLV